MPIIKTDDYNAYQKCNEIVDAYQRRITLAAWLTKIIKTLGGSPPIVVGGTAVSVYSGNSYATMDVDFISNSEEIAKEVLLELGYAKSGKDFYHKGLESLIEFPSRDYLEDPKRFSEYTVPSTDLVIYLVGIDDLILDRIGSYDATDDLSSKEWATRLMLAYYDHIDWSYLHSTSHKRKFLPKLEALQHQVKYLKNKQETEQEKDE
jgi:hypothetical protein